MSPALGIKFSRGPGPQVKACLLLWNIDLKTIALKQLIRKNLNMSAAHILGSRHPLIGFLTYFFRDNIPLREQKRSDLSSKYGIFIPRYRSNLWSSIHRHWKTKANDNKVVPVPIANKIAYHKSAIVSPSPDA
jgi:hypothetical protein